MPRIKHFRSTHTCVLFHQMSMIHFNGNPFFNSPLTYDDTARDRMDTHVSMRSYLLVHDALKTRNLELLQQDQTFQGTLGKTCLCCGKSVTLTGLSYDITRRHRHAIQCLIQMVIQRRMHEHLTTCDWCGITIVPTHATSEYDDHLAAHTSYTCLFMEVEPEDVPRPKRALPWEQPSRRPLPDKNNEALHHQNTYILFLSTGQDSMMLQLLQATAQWKQQQQSQQVNHSLRQCLMLSCSRPTR